MGKLKSTLAIVTFCSILFIGCSNDVEQFLGAYQVNDDCGGGNFTYTMTISESATADNTIAMQNFGNLGIIVTATVDGNNITIPSQTVTVGQSTFTLSGNGNIDGNVFEFFYSSGTTSCSANATKQ